MARHGTAKAYRAVFAVVAWFGLGLQYWLAIRAGGQSAG